MLFEKEEEFFVTKIEAAKVQLDAAIKLYFEGRCIEAITLAGAAEEITGAMLRRDGIKSTVETLAELPQMRQNFESIKARIKFLNNPKNNLKHANDSDEDFFIISQYDPYIMIVRALGNFSLLSLDESTEMKKFREYHKTSKSG